MKLGCLKQKDQNVFLSQRERNIKCAIKKRKFEHCEKDINLTYFLNEPANFIMQRSSSSQMFFKLVALKDFAIFTGKHLCWSLFLIKLQAWRPATLLKRDSDTGAFCEICEILKNIWELLLLFSIQHSYLLIFKKPCALTPFCWTPIGVFRNLLIIFNGAFCENSQWFKFLTAFAKMFHHRSLTASKTALTTSTAHLDSVIKYILSHMLFSQHILSQVFKGWKLLNRLDISKRILQPMRLNSNCCGVMDNGCFHHGLPMIIRGKSDIFNVILIIALNTGKNC